LGYNFNESIEWDNLPTGLKRLTISKDYISPIDNLPVSVEIIRY